MLEFQITGGELEECFTNLQNCRKVNPENFRPTNLRLTCEKFLEVCKGLKNSAVIFRIPLMVRDFQSTNKKKKQ